ncbi:MAG: hypothetical protein H6Q07_1659 [Acidobacteria bacterium]|jgi:hypothetical protein|nr:hypothetical protein [Acidobacteriota bacterium]
MVFDVKSEAKEDPFRAARKFWEDAGSNSIRGLEP